MIRRPVVNSLLNANRTARQLLGRRNAFEEAVADGAASTSGSSAFELRDTTSNALWLLACNRARRSLDASLKRADSEGAVNALAKLGDLLRMGEALASFGVLRPSWLTRPAQKVAWNWYGDGMRQGVKAGAVVPGSTTAIPAKHLLSIKVEASTMQLMERERTHKQEYMLALQKAMAGNGHLNLGDEDLPGLNDKMKSVWASSFGSWAVWQQSRYKVPIGRDALIRIMPYCQNAATRAQIFEGYYSGFGDALHESCLQLLRTRRELAQRYGFRNWAEYELRPLSVSDPAEAHKLMDRFWQGAQPSLSPFLKKIGEHAEASGTALPGRGPNGERRVAHLDEAFYRALVTHEADTWKLAEYLPETSIPQVLEVVGRIYNVSFDEVHRPSLGRTQLGWHPSVRIYEVIDGGRGSMSGRSSLRGRLGFVYVDLYQRQQIGGRSASELSGAQIIAKGHAYLSMNLQEAGLGARKLFNPEEIVALSHELGHAVHMLCFDGSPREFDEMPLDILELPSVLAETVALHPDVMAQYAHHHASRGPPPTALLRSCQRDPYFYINCLQTWSVTLGLHGDSFDPHAATASELRSAATAMWQRYSPVQAHPTFSPLGDAGLQLAEGCNQVAYMLCYLRVDAILYGGKRPASGREAAQRWLSPEFSGRLRAQLLDQRFAASRLAQLLPPLAREGAQEPPRHPLPPPPSESGPLFSRLLRQVA